MPSLMPHCRVTDVGIDHHFVGIDLGVACACGRKVASLSVEHEEFEVRDVMPRPSLTLGALSRTAGASVPVTRTERLLRLGADTIRRSRQLCRAAAIARHRRALGPRGVTI